VDVRLSPEQVALRDAAGRAADRLGPRAVAALSDAERTANLDAAVGAAGWRELRTAAGDGRPWASAVEVAIVAEELGRALADTPFVGPTVAAELRRLAGAPQALRPETVALSADLAGPAWAEAENLRAGAVAPDAAGATAALVLLHGNGGVALGAVRLSGTPPGGADLTRPSVRVQAGATVVGVDDQARPLGPDALARWHALGLAVAGADLVGVMRGALALACDYARTRRQYGAAIGSFQAVQHLLADAHVATEGAHSIARHAAWAVDALPGADALAAASAAKAYCARAARTVCETAIQVHGGIGNTWDCLAHVFLRRALVSGELLGGVGASLERVLAARGLGGGDGLR
jgi:acyl-CoA dehydrogenase-like protein